jgi:hypothetical protein
MDTCRRSPARLCCAILFVVATLLIVACGSSSSTRSTVAPGDQSAASRDIVHNGAVTQRPINGTGGKAVNDDNPGRADSGGTTATGQHPCTLVSKAEAQAIIGKPVATPQEAPLGPTCIYQPRGATNTITLAVESMSSPRIKPQAQLHGRVLLNLAHHRAYCGTLGDPTLIVPLSRARFLVVTATCPVSTRFATIALNRLGG